jgi:alpha-1,3-rhamnosyl/mannosyltransferase
MPDHRPIAVGLDYRPALLGTSGIPRAVRELARALAARADLDLHLFGHAFARRRTPEAPPPRASLHRTRLPGRALPWLARCGIDAARLCGGPRIFHWTDFVFPPVGPRTAVVMTLHDCAFAVDPDYHGAGSATLLARTRAAVGRADLVVCPTRATADDAVAHLGLAAARLRVIPFGADHGAEPDPRPPFDGAPFVLMLGTIEPRKNHLRALAAWRALGPGRPGLVVVGRPGWNCEAEVAALRDAVARDGVRWLAAADEPTVATLVAHARALLYPSLLEGFGFPPLEALRRGVPVVGGDTPALREVGGEAVVWCDPTAVDAIRAALLRALEDADDPELRRARRARAAGFRWAGTAAAHADAYRGLLG